jgi:hypothetical protein
MGRTRQDQWRLSVGVDGLEDRGYCRMGQLLQHAEARAIGWFRYAGKLHRVEPS